MITLEFKNNKAFFEWLLKNKELETALFANERRLFSEFNYRIIVGGVEFNCVWEIIFEG